VLALQEPQQRLEARRVDAFGGGDAAEMIDDDIDRQGAEAGFVLGVEVHVELQVPAQRLDALREPRRVLELEPRRARSDVDADAAKPGGVQILELAIGDVLGHDRDTA